jgi:predicted phage tail protein
MSADKTITADFAINTYVITASAGAGGTISPSGSATVNYNGSKTFTITPNAGYKISDVIVDNVSVGAVSTYTFSNITDNHTISASFAVITPPIPAAPTNLTATAISGRKITLTWVDNSSNESGFKIERSTDGTTFSRIKTVGANVKTFTNTGLTSGRMYYYRVRAYNSAGNSDYSNTASATARR